MDEPKGEWVVKVHPDPRVLEGIYPAQPAPGAVERYFAAVEGEVARLGSAPFDVLVDQRAAPVLPDDVSERMSTLLAWAHERGLRRLVRVVRRSAVAELQAWRIVREAGLGDERQELFYSRDDAWAALSRR